MKQGQGLLSQLMELGRLLKSTRISVLDALGLLIEQLRYFEEAEQREEDLQHAEFPKHIYGY